MKEPDRKQPVWVRTQVDQSSDKYTDWPSGIKFGTRLAILFSHLAKAWDLTSLYVSDSEDA